MFLLRAYCKSSKRLTNIHISLFQGVIVEVGSWIYIYLCNTFLSPLKLWVRILLMARCTR